MNKPQDPWMSYGLMGTKWSCMALMLSAMFDKKTKHTISAKNLKHTVKHSGGGVMIWDSFAAWTSDWISAPGTNFPSCFSLCHTR